MTIKLFIAFLVFCLNTAIWITNALFPATPCSPLFVCCRFFVPTELEHHSGWEEGERMWQAIDTPPPRKLWFFTVLYVPALWVLFWDLQGCFWIIAGYKPAFFSSLSQFQSKPPIHAFTIILFKVKQQNKSIANSHVQFSKLSISAQRCAYKVIFSAAVHAQAREPCINPQLQWPFL